MTLSTSPSPIYIDDYYPLNAVLAYMYPAGVDQESKFTNTVPPWIEELVAARILTSSMDPDGTLKALCFDATTQKVMQIMTDLGYPIPDESRVLRLPSAINLNLKEAQRNEAIANALLKEDFISEGSLFMAQALIRDRILKLYAPGADRFPELGDKGKLDEMFDADQLPERLKRYESGSDFLEDNVLPRLPFVVKLANSSSGDGVQVCRSSEDIQKAKLRFGSIDDVVVIDEFREGQNIGILMGKRPNGKIDLIGWNEQVTDRNGEYLAGIIRSGMPIPEAYQGINSGEKLQEKLKPYTGLFGVDGIDGKIIDPNIRPVAPTPFIMQAANGQLWGRNAFTFNGRFRGELSTLQRWAQFDDANAIIRLAGLVKTSEGFNVNGAVLFDQKESMAENIRTAVRLGFSSGAFNQILLSRAA